MLIKSLLAALWAVGSMGSVGALHDQDPISVLVISGANNHDWEWTTPSLASMLEESGRFQVTITYQPAELLARARALEAFDVFVLDYNGPRWGEAAETNFLEAVRGGTGVTVVHAANNAFPGWIEYEKLVGLLWRRAGDVTTGHGTFHAFDVTIVDRDHPLTATLPTLRQHPDELYHRLIPMHGVDQRVLASAYSDPETGGTGQDEPMIIVGRYGAGRVFHTPLGHVWRGVEASRVSHADPQFRALVVKGTEWAATGDVDAGVASPNRLTSLERDAGWRLLFDGETLDGWRAYGGQEAPEGWSVTSGCLHRVVHAGDLVTEGEFEDFELRFEWKIPRGVNSGVKIRVQEQPNRPAPIGLEYQILDDGAYPDLPGMRKSGALYDLMAPAEKTLRHLTDFNTSRIVARGAVVEHWLNGERVLVADMDSEDWKARVAQSKFGAVEGFGRGAGRIVLQDHGDEVWFRSIAIRPLPPAAPQRSLLPEPDLSGWRSVGDALYRVEEDVIVGETGGGSHSFLLTEETFGDFVLEVDLRTEGQGNSGIQVRSQQSESGQVYGYQVEIDPSPRAWSGGLYDEARRGWLDDLSDDSAARAAFRPGEWNRYRIECVGPSIRTWVNGMPAADVLDPIDLEGFIGFQVHSGRGTKVTWRQPTLWDLGRREWEPFAQGEGLADWQEQEQEPASWSSSEAGLVASAPGRLVSRLQLDDFTLRLAFREEGEGFTLLARLDGEGAGRLSELVPGLSLGPDGWMVHPARLDGYRAGERNVLALCAYGPRLAVHLNGTRAADVTRRDASLAGALALASGAEQGALVQIEELQLLSQPRR